MKFTDFKNRVVQIVVFGLITAALGYLFVDHRFGIGVIAGLPFSIFNFWLVASAVEGLEGESPRRSQNRFMLRSFLRMFISMAVLFISIKWGIYFMLGVAMGLILQMLTYFKDAVKLLSGKG
ncbi:MAG: hypothetical protein PWQ96_706 [Clostridia bacterium]|nr:hypothetical protein [Clostridiales bacterium]MDK2985064.1 hypothetical protein [Clostridia bacterium]